MNAFIEELKWRGLYADMMPGTDEQLNKEMTTAYIGFDPTADSLHIGSLIQIKILAHFQQHGHKPIALVGGATGMISDPSGKSSERNLLDEATLNHYVDCIKGQLSRFLNFEGNEPNKAELVNNYDWMKTFTFLDFVRDIGKHLTVNYMMAKDSVKKRFSGEAGVDGMSFTEFTYQLLQGYDFLHLYKNKGVKLILPVDTKVGKEFKPDTESKTVAWTEIPADWEGFDIGEKTIEIFSEEIRQAKTVVWNGPVGLFEFNQFAIGTNAIAKVLSEIDATTIIGGGDSAAAVKKAGLQDKMTHISTGGGASLEFLEGKKLPGIECLLDK